MTHRSAMFLALALTGALLGACQQPNAWPHQQAGDQALASQNWDRAAASYEKALEARPDLHPVRNGLARAYIGQGKALAGAEQAKIAFAQRPDIPEYADTVAEALLAADRKDEMFRFLRQNTAERGRVDDWVRLGVFARRAGDPDSAQTALLTAARVDRGLTPEPQLALHEFYTALGQRDEADRRLRMAYFAGPRNPMVRTRLANLGINPGPDWGLVPVERSEP